MTPHETNLSRRSLLAGLGTTAAVVAAASAANAQTSARRADPHGRFAGKVVIVTGATSGIGRVTAEEFAREGARVVFNGRREALGREVEAGIRAFGGEATYVRSDVRDPAQVQAFVDGAVARYGKLDVVFANAGIGQPFVDATELKRETVADMFATNVQGKYETMVAATTHLVANGGGAIVHTSSIFGIKAGAQAVAYSASMHAISGMTLGAAQELAGRKIRVNAVAPGAITDTDFMVPIMGRRLNAEEIASFRPFHALGRTGSSLEVAKAVLFLASDDASFITGEVMKVDGYFLRG